MRRAVIVLVMLAGLGALGFVALVGRQPAPQAQAQPAPPPARLRILVAARPVRAGTLIVPDDVESKDIVAADMPSGATRDEPDARAAIRGAMVRQSLGKGDPILADGLLKPGDRGFLAAVLRPGMRAVSVGVDAVSGTAGLIWPGDRVDVILTEAAEDQATPPGRRISGEAVLQDAQVIAIDQQIVRGVPPDGVLPNANINSRTVTLEVGARDAERIAVATRLGKLALVVRSAGPDAKDDGARDGNAQAAGIGGADAAGRDAAVVWGSDVSAALRAKPDSKIGSVVKLYSGAAQPTEFKY